MNKKRVLWLVAGLYICIIVSMITIFWLTNQQRKFVIDLGELNAGLRMINWMLLILTGGLAILTRKILPTDKKDEVISENDQKEVEKNEILSIYLSSGESFFHEMDSMDLGSQEIIAAWKNKNLGEKLVIEDSDGVSMYAMDQIAAITILFE